MATTEVELVTPTRSLFSGQADEVITRTEGGEIAFLADHMPYLGVLVPAVTRIVHGGAEDRFVTHGGFVQVHNNRVVMLVDVAEKVDELDRARAERARSEAERAVGADAEDDAAQAALRRAQARLDAAGQGSGH